jgi:hypothetical protein
VTLGRQLRRPELPTAGARWCAAALPEGSVYRFLARERARLFPPELFADLFEPTGAPLGAAVDPGRGHGPATTGRLVGSGGGRPVRLRRALAVRRRVADAVPGEETASFAHTVLVDLRARLRRSQDSDRIFRVTCELARQVGLVGVKRVLDSAPLEDAVTPRTRSRCCGVPSGGCCAPARHCWPRRSASCCSARTTTAHPASQLVTGPTGPPGRRWWTRWSATPTGPTLPCGTSGWIHEPPKQRCSWPP